MVLRGPSSIQTLKNPSRSRINRFGLTSVPAALVPFIATVVCQLKLPMFSCLIGFQIYFLLRGSGSFEYDPEGDEEYEGFFRDRYEEMVALGPKSLSRLLGRLDEEVFGIKRKEATAEQKRQREFSKRRLQEIKAQAAREDAEEGDANSKQGPEPSGSGSRD